MLHFRHKKQAFDMRTSMSSVLATLLVIFAAQPLALAQALSTTTVTSTITVATFTTTITLSRSTFLTTETTAIAYATGLPPASTTTMSSSTTNTIVAGQDLVKAVINSTNFFRGTFQASPVSWNSTLASYASDYADNCVFKHSGGPYGENLAVGYGTVALAIDAWAAEEGQYNWGRQGFSESTGHFTQLVWKNTTSVGCGLVQCDNQAGDGAKGPYLVCEYFPPGNVQGEYVSNIGKAGVGSDGKLAMGGAAGRSVECRRAVAALVVTSLFVSVLLFA